MRIIEMHPDDYADDPYLDEGEGEASLTYDDGFGEPFALDEADHASRPKRSEKTRGTATRKNTPKVVAATRRQVQRDTPRHAKRGTRRNRKSREARRLARLRWDVLKQLLIKHSRMIVRDPLTAAIMAVMESAFIQGIVRRVVEGTVAVTDPADFVSVSVRGAIAEAVAVGARLHGRMSTKQQKALTEAVFQGLDAADKVIQVAARAAGSTEAEDPESWEDDLEFGGFADRESVAWEDFSDGETVRPRGRAGAAPSAERRRCAEALRKSAKFLLRMERRLNEGGR